MIEKEDKKFGQVSVFIILGILILIGFFLIFVLKEKIFGLKIPKDFDEIYNYYLSCINEETLNGIKIIEQQGGYIKSPAFVPGSSYMPFSSQLNFLGYGIPYWFYISGNGIMKEQVPTKLEMEEQLNDFLKNQISNCDFSVFEQRGFNVESNDVESVKTEINSNYVRVNVKQKISFNYGNSSFFIGEHKKDVKSNLGKFYDLGLKIYNYQKESSFLENYSIDILRFYVPVDNVEITCGPKIWFVKDIKKKISDAVEANIPFVKIKGDYYRISKKDNEYFVKDIGENVDANVNFLYLKEWPMKIEVWPSEDGVLKADPIGMQEGLGVLGFCYVPYHFVYDLAYPVLIQIYYGDEMFQYPVVVFVNKNKPKYPLEGSALQGIVPELCMHRIQKVKVSTFNSNLEPVNSTISFKCFDTNCDIGKTSLKNGESYLEDYIPQCVNGFIIASAEGYKTKKHIIRSLSESDIQIVLDKKYNLGLEVENIKEGSYAVISFVKNNESLNLVYPEQKEIELTEGQYDVKVYVYSNSDIDLGKISSEKCVEIPKSGLFGVLGFTEKKCFEIEVPEDMKSAVLVGGGKSSYYIAESELQNSKKIVISPEFFDVPKKIEDLQYNYYNVEKSIINIRFVS